MLGEPLAVTMRTPGHDVELAAGFLVSEGIISHGSHFRSAIHCGGPGQGGDGNTYNVLDVALAPGVTLPTADAARRFYTTSSCGVCGKASIDAATTTSSYDVTTDDVRIPAAAIASLPDRLREEQAAFEKTGGLHAAALFDVDADALTVVREDVGRHNAVDKVVGWATLGDRLPSPAPCCRFPDARASNSSRRPSWPASRSSQRCPRRPRSPWNSPSAPVSR